jgi:hypothetical protein
MIAVWVQRGSEWTSGVKLEVKQDLIVQDNPQAHGTVPC